MQPKTNSACRVLDCFLARDLHFLLGDGERSARGKDDDILGPCRVPQINHHAHLLGALPADLQGLWRALPLGATSFSPGQKK